MGILQKYYMVQQTSVIECLKTLQNTRQYHKFRENWKVELTAEI